MNKEYKELKEKGTEGLADVEELGVEYMNLELSSFKSTKEFVEAFKKSGRQLHVLICNAGIMARNYGKHMQRFNTVGLYIDDLFVIQCRNSSNT